jgi:hypothetical protein
VSGPTFSEVVLKHWLLRDTNDGVYAIGRLTDICRNRGMNYNDIKAFFEQVLGKSIDLAEWDDVLYRYDGQQTYRR